MPTTTSEKVAASLETKRLKLAAAAERVEANYNAKTASIAAKRQQQDAQRLESKTARLNALSGLQLECTQSITQLGGVPSWYQPPTQGVSGGDHGNNDDPPAAPVPTPN